MKTKEISLMGLMVAFISVAAQISIPIKPVPFTLQTMLILIAGLTLGSRKGGITVLIYVLVGCIGLPVFAGFTGGVGVLFMPSGGFIMSFPLMAFVTGLFDEMFSKKVYSYVGCFIGSALNFAVGCGFFMYIMEKDLITALKLVVFPFVITNIIQIIFAVEISNFIKKVKKL